MFHPTRTFQIIGARFTLAVLAVTCAGTAAAQNAIAFGTSTTNNLNWPAATKVRQISVASDLTLILQPNGRVLGFGNNDTNFRRSGPVAVSNDVKVKFVSTAVGASGGSGVLLEDGTIQTWTAYSGTPTGNGYQRLAISVGFAVAQRADGTLRTWGFSGPTLDGVQNGLPASRVKTFAVGASARCVAILPDGSLMRGDRRLRHGPRYRPALTLRMCG